MTRKAGPNPKNQRSENIQILVKINSADDSSRGCPGRRERSCRSGGPCLVGQGLARHPPGPG